MAYAQPWLNAQMRETAVSRYSNTLEMSYAQPWLDAQRNETAVNRYINVLEMQFPQPWLNKQQMDACSDRLDIIYVWRFGKRPCYSHNLVGNDAGK